MVLRRSSNIELRRSRSTMIRSHCCASKTESLTLWQLPTILCSSNLKKSGRKTPVLTEVQNTTLARRLTICKRDLMIFRTGSNCHWLAVFQEDHPSYPGTG